jgi:hypothetical protein
MNAESAQAIVAVPWEDPGVNSLASAVLYTLAYSDVFDYPLSPNEVWRYLIGTRASHPDVERALSTTPGIETNGAVHYLADREVVAEMRSARAQIAQAMWPRVRKYASRIARLPFVRMVSLTGALAMINARASDDYDFLIVTEPGYLWLTRAMVIALVVRPGALQGDEVCPNYFITTDNLTFESHDLFTAHELAQMVPLSGKDLYTDLRRQNAWAHAFLPNAQGAPVQLAAPPVAEGGWLSRRMAEPLLRNDLGAYLDRWEMARKVPQLSDNAASTEVALGRDQCKGHIGAHQRWVYNAFCARVAQLQARGLLRDGA